MISWRQRLGLSALACTLLVGLPACSPIKSTHGALIPPSRLQQVHAGLTTDMEVREILGTPSTQPTFDERTWFYIGQKRQRVGIFQPRITERQVVAIQFNDEGIVTRVAQFDLSDGVEVTFVDRETPTAGQDLSAIREILGNIGRFNTDQSGLSTIGPVGPTGGGL